MADMLNIASLSLNTFQKALEVTSHNIANASTEGYNRQQVIIESNAPGTSSTNFQGGGASVGGVDRVYSEYMQTQLYSSLAMKERYATQESLATQVEGIIASNDEGVQEFMGRYFDSLQSLANNPTSTTSRQLVLQEANNLESHIGNLSAVLGDIEGQTNNQISDVVTEVNSRLVSIQEMNIEINNILTNTTSQPNDLLDKRDQAILEISGYMDIKTYYHDNGEVDLYAAGGRVPLLSGNTLTQLEAGKSDYPDENRTEIFARVGDQKQIISKNIVGGELGGLLDFRDNMLGQAQNDLGVALNGMAASLNWQSYQGYDANGDAGGNVFTPLNMNAIDNIENTGPVSGLDIQVSFNPNAGASEPPYDGVTALSSQPATYGDKLTFLEKANAEIGQFEAREYEFFYNQATDSFDFFDYQTKSPVLDNAGNPVAVARGGAANVEGMYFDFTAVVAAPADGDSFLVKPHQQILESFTAEMKDIEKIATRGQSPIDSNNDGSIKDEVPAAAAEGDNVNVANMAALQSAKMLFSDSDGRATESILGGYSQMAVGVGMYVRGTDIQLTAQTSVYDVMVAQRESYSGVSLDEEAANLVKFQQAYQASAQIISTVQELFRTILDVSR
ncbi:MAG: flagellar hook-associated protein FlgK [Gammaproteobacteria bacterium]|nr:flagellar hook-associated protein FlgK [Gammaproteobacteria bacterium]